MKPRISSRKYLLLIEEHFKIHKICALLGPRQCGKTTLSYEFKKQEEISDINRFDLENPLDLERLAEPMLALSSLKGKFVIIDEIQYKPELFPILRVLVDQKDIKFLILGSASRDLINHSSETLAGRIGYIEMTPFQMAQVKDIDTLWLRGGFPSSYLAENESLSSLWRKNYIQTFLERDIPMLGLSIPSIQLRKFWLMICHYHGGIFNASEIGRSLGISYHTVQHYLSILNGTFMVRILPPWYENLKKRQVKTPKIYFRDSGLYHTLMGFTDSDTLTLSPKIGASWEGFALEEIIRYYDADIEECYFWASHSTAQIDLLIIKNDKRIGFEFKYTDRPRITNSITIALEDIKLDEVKIIFPGSIRFYLSDKVEAVGLATLSNPYQLSSMKDQYMIITKEGTMAQKENLSEINSRVFKGTPEEFKEELKKRVKEINDLGIKSCDFNGVGVNSHGYSLGTYESTTLMQISEEFNHQHRPNFFINGEVIKELIKDKVLKSIELDKYPEEENIILYFDKEEYPIHSGVVSSAEKIKSKWGVLPAIFEHAVDETPYLNACYFKFYFKPTFSELEKAIIKFHQNKSKKFDFQ